MILGFKDEFVPLVEDGSKTHSIRAGERWRVGMRADLFEKTRQPKIFALRATKIPEGCICHGDGLHGMVCEAQIHAPAKLKYERFQVGGMRLLFRAEVVRVERIQIRVRHANLAYARPYLEFRIEGIELSRDEAEAFAWRDGFRKPENMFRGGSLQQMYAFWRREHGAEIDTNVFHGQLIHWDYAQRFTDRRKPQPAVTMAKALAWGRKFESLPNVRS